MKTFIRIYIMTLLSFVTLCSLQSQNSISSLETKLTNSNGKSYIDAALKLSDLYYNNTDHKKVIELTEKAIEQSESQSNYKQSDIYLKQARSYLALGARTGSNLPKCHNAVAKSVETASTVKHLENARAILHTIQRFSIGRKLKKNIEKTVVKIEEKESEVDQINLEEERVIAKSPDPITYRADIQNQIVYEKTALARTITSLSDQNSDLKTALERDKKAIEEMNAFQAKAALELAQRNRMIDSFTYESIIDSMTINSNALLISQNESRLKEQDQLLQLKSAQKNLFMALAVMGLLILAGLYLRYRGVQVYTAQLEEKNVLIEEEKKKSDELLLNILPKAVAHELKTDGKATTQFYKSGTVFFSDFVNFSEISKSIEPKELVKLLHECFSAFDKIVQKYDLEKIKTIGDAYMFCGGIPTKSKDHTARAVLASMDINKFLYKWNQENIKQGRPVLRARIGLHTGPLIAGVVGKNKFAYDVWGDTVNIAARMESAGAAGKINVSKSTYELVKGQFKAEKRGKIDVKNMDAIEMYYLEAKSA